MKTPRTLLTLLAVLCVAACTKAPVHSPSIPKDPAIEKQIDRIMSKMTLDDKVGQMLQINLDVLGGYAFKDGRAVWVLDEAKVPDPEITALNQILGDKETYRALLLQSRREQRPFAEVLKERIK